MSLSQRTLHRLPSIKHGLLSGLTTAQIGDKLGVTEKTIDRDLKTFVQSGEFESWIKEEWLRLHNIILHEDPTEAYRNITKLVSRMLTQKVESQELRYERIEFVAPWQNKYSSQQTTTPPTPDNESSITIDTATASSVAADDGAKTTAQSTKPSNTASQTEA